MKKVNIDTLLTIVNHVFHENEENALITTSMLDEDIAKDNFDSFSFIKLIIIIEEEFECEIPDEKLLISEMNTINKIYKVLKELESQNA